MDNEHSVLYMLGKLDGKLDTISGALAEIKMAATSLETRVTALEHARNYLIGAWSVLALIAGSVYSYLLASK